MNNIEIELERTYLASKLPAEISSAHPKRIVDIYIPDDMDTHPHLRIRDKGGKFEITKKVLVDANDASVQTEMTIPLDEAEFLCLKQSSHRIVEKDRYKILIDGFTAEIDVFQGALKGLVLVDFEFKSIQQKDDFVPPEFCLADVTQDEFIAGGKLAGLKYSDIEKQLLSYGYNKL